MAVWAIVWSGNMLRTPEDEFQMTESGAWAGLAYWFGADWIFCTIMCSAGIAQFAALTINGTFHDTVYARYSPLVRAATAFLCCGCWLMVWLSSTAANTQGAVAYWAPALINGIIAYYVGGEFGDTLGKHKNGRSNTN